MTEQVCLSASAVRTLRACAVAVLKLGLPVSDEDTERVEAALVESESALLAKRQARGGEA